MNTLQILPGILEKEWEAIERKLQIVKPFAKAIHIDLLDGKFAPNTSFLDPKPFKQYSQDFFFELHMMVEDPESYLEPFARAGFRRFLGHVEKMPDQASFVARGEELGEVGLAIDAGTDLTAITVPYIDLDTLLVMTVKAGFSHQSFLPEQLALVQKLAGDRHLPIEVDGGINDQTIQEAYRAGARRFVSTNFIYVLGEPKQQYEALQKACLSASSSEVESAR